MMWASYVSSTHFDTPTGPLVVTTELYLAPTIIKIFSLGPGIGHISTTIQQYSLIVHTDTHVEQPRIISALSQHFQDSKIGWHTYSIYSCDFLYIPLYVLTQS